MKEPDLIEFKQQKRSRLQMFIDILRVIDSGECKPTRIMYKSNLSWIPLNKILKQMLSLKLIRKHEKSNRQLFMTTRKGERLLEKIDDLKKILQPSIHRLSCDLDSILSNPSIEKEPASLTLHSKKFKPI